MIQRWNNVPCPGCGCVCDDISVTLDGPRLVDFSPTCQLGETWFRSHLQIPAVAFEIRGQPVSQAEAVDLAVSLLQDADYPLIYGLSRSATPGQRAAIALGDFLGAAVDTTASLCHGPSIMALQEFGEVTSTLGEIRNRADLVIFWGCNPAESHPRHAERYSVTCSGRFTPNGRNSRRIVLIGNSDQISQWKIDSHGTLPDLVIPVAPGQDFEVLGSLRRMLTDTKFRDVPDELNQLMELIRASHYGVFFFGLGLAGTGAWSMAPQPSAGHANVGALLQLVAELNAVTRFTARRMRLQGDVSGADNVLCWQTGYPFGVDFSRGYPRYNPGEFTANELLERHDTDTCLLVGAETVSCFSPAAQQHLKTIPTVVIDYPGVPLSFTPTVRITTSVYGLHAAGTVYRMDNVPIQLHGMLPTELPTDQQVLEAILKGCRGKDHMPPLTGLAQRS